MKKLEEHRLLKHLGNGVYVITERGEKYLDGELDTSEDAPDDCSNEVKNNGHHTETPEEG
jgi:repressor of nif and glnA expression